MTPARRSRPQSESPESVVPVPEVVVGRSGLESQTRDRQGKRVCADALSLGWGLAALGRVTRIP